MYWTGFTLITCKNSIAGPIVNTQSVVVLVWIILGVSIKPGLCYDIPESLYGRTGVTVYLAPLDSLPPGGQNFPGNLTPHPDYLHPRGVSCPGQFILPPTHSERKCF